MHNHHRLFGAIALVLLVLAACQPAFTPSISPESSPIPSETAEVTSTPTAAGINWWDEAVFYEIFVRSFKDSDGDGIGDFQGIIQQLDYLNDGDPNTTDDLGINAIWLMPIYPSPSYHGYDVTDYQDVNPYYGTLEDFQQLLEECHARGIRVIIDFVINHTSDKHPWFQAALDPTSPYHEYYVWSDTKPAGMGPLGQESWFKAPNGKYYYAVFWSGMPDLNYNNPKVTEEIYAATQFWLDKGVDGFRVDAARYLFEDGEVLQDANSTLKWFQDWRAFYKQINPQAFTVGEVWTDTQNIARYGTPNGLDSLFIFDLADAFLNGLLTGNAAIPLKSYKDAIAYFPDYSFSTFLSNHDQTRVMTALNEQEIKAKSGAFMYLTGPGIPFIYYGEEIGMTGNKPDEMLRTPMQWSAEANAGFTTGNPWEQINEGWEQTNVAVQAAQPDSLLNWYKELIHLREANPTLRMGSFVPLNSNCKEVYAVLREYEGETLLSVANLSLRPVQNCSLNLRASDLSGSYQAEALWGELLFEQISFAADGSLDNFIVAPELAGGETAILRLVRP
jgi:glycosidase